MKANKTETILQSTAPVGCKRVFVCEYEVTKRYGLCNQLIILANSILISHYGKRDVVLPQKGGFILDCIHRKGETIPWKHVLDIDHFNKVTGPKLGLSCQILTKVPDNCTVAEEKFPWNRPHWDIFMKNKISFPRFCADVERWSEKTQGYVELWNMFSLEWFTYGKPGESIKDDTINMSGRLNWTSSLISQFKFSQELCDIAEEAKMIIFGTGSEPLGRRYNVLHMRIEDDSFMFQDRSKGFAKRVSRDSSMVEKTLVTTFTKIVEDNCCTRSASKDISGDVSTEGKHLQGKDKSKDKKKIPLYIASDLNKNKHKLSWLLDSFKDKYNVLTNDFQSVMPRLHNFVTNIELSERALTKRSRVRLMDTPPFHYRDLSAIIELLVCMGGERIVGCEWSTFSEAMLTRLQSDNKDENACSVVIKNLSIVPWPATHWKPLPIINI